MKTLTCTYPSFIAITCVLDNICPVFKVICSIFSGCAWLIVFPLFMLGVYAKMYNLFSLAISYFILQVGKKVERAARSPSSPSGLFFQHAGHRFEYAFLTPLTYS